MRIERVTSCETNEFGFQVGILPTRLLAVMPPMKTRMIGTWSEGPGRSSRSRIEGEALKREEENNNNGNHQGRGFLVRIQ